MTDRGAGTKVQLFWLNLNQFLHVIGQKISLYWKKISQRSYLTAKSWLSKDKTSLGKLSIL